MILCPIALAAGCRKCPLFKACPVKSVIGDYRPDLPASSTAPAPPDKPRVKARPAARTAARTPRRKKH